MGTWYKEQISDYRPQRASGEFMGKVVKELDPLTQSVKKTIPIHIFKPQNMGAIMCVDEKMLSGTYYLMVSNLITGKIAMMLASLKHTVMLEALKEFGSKVLEKVERVNCDMSPTIKKLCNDAFTKASIVVDKFHVIKHVVDAINTTRLNQKKKLKVETKASKSNVNSWTDIELLEKVKHLLYQAESELKEEQSQILNAVLEKFPAIKEAYELGQEIKKWYHKSNIGKLPWQIVKEREVWMIEMEKTKLKEFKQIRKMFDKHEEDINRFFEKGYTNSKAENLNARIQRFVSNNFGMRDKDFVCFRISVYFA